MSKKQAPLVSIIVPIYNVENYLKDCFKSIASQSYENIEIILVDDGATDSSGVIADNLAKNNINTKVLHKKNGGLSDARNAGMKLAKGEYISFVDSDDCIGEDFVKTLLELAVKNNADIAQCDNSRDIENIGNGKGNIKILSSENAFIDLLKYKTVSPTAWGKLYKKSLFDSNNLEFPVGRIHEDTALLYKLVYCSNVFACTDKVLYYYRMNNNSITTSNYTEQHYRSVIKYHDELDEFIVKNDVATSSKILNRHKALRLLSILNKLALHKKDESNIYKDLKNQYIDYSKHSGSPICYFGIIPAYFPVLFRKFYSLTPVARRVLGKN